MGGSRKSSKVIGGTLQWINIQRGDRLNFTLFSPKSAAQPPAINNDRSLMSAKPLFWASYGVTNHRRCVSYFPSDLLPNWTMALLKGQLWRVLKSWYSDGAQNKDFCAASPTDLTRSFVSSTAQVRTELNCTCLSILSLTSSAGSVKSTSAPSILILSPTSFFALITFLRYCKRNR